MKIGVKIATHFSANVSTYAPRARYIFFDWKKHGYPERAYTANGHVFARQQSYKTTESEDAHANEGRQKRI